MEDKSLWLLSINCTAEIVVVEAGVLEAGARWCGSSQEASLLL